MCGLFPGLVLKKKAAYDEAGLLYERAIAIVLKAFGPEEGKLHYKYGMIALNLADIFRKKGIWNRALELYEDSERALIKSLGASHSEVAEVYYCRGLVQHQLGRYEEALALFQQNLVILEKNFSPSHYKARKIRVVFLPFLCLTFIFSGWNDEERHGTCSDDA